MFPSHINPTLTKYPTLSVSILNEWEFSSDLNRLSNLMNYILSLPDPKTTT